MAADLNTFRARVAGLLADPSGLAWTNDGLDAALRQALGEYSLARGAGQTIAGLDGAAETSVSPLHETILALGGAGYALFARLIRRSECLTLPLETAARLSKLGFHYLERFHMLIEAVRQAAFREAPDAPWSVWEEE